MCLEVCFMEIARPVNLQCICESLINLTLQKNCVTEALNKMKESTISDGTKEINKMIQVYGSCMLYPFKERRGGDGNKLHSVI